MNIKSILLATVFASSNLFGASASTLDFEISVRGFPFGSFFEFDAIVRGLEDNAINSSLENPNLELELVSSNFFVPQTAADILRNSLFPVGAEVSIPNFGFTVEDGQIQLGGFDLVGVVDDIVALIDATGFNNNIFDDFGQFNAFRDVAGIRDTTFDTAGDFELLASPIAPVPLPASALLLLLGIGGLAGLRRRGFYSS